MSPHRPIPTNLHRHGEGRALGKIVDAPYFVDSRFTVGIQLADLVAGTLRQYYESELYLRPAPNAYLSAISRYHRIIREKSREIPDPAGTDTWHGIHLMSEGRHYFDRDGDEA